MRGLGEGRAACGRTRGPWGALLIWASTVPLWRGRKMTLKIVCVTLLVFGCSSTTDAADDGAPGAGGALPGATGGNSETTGGDAVALATGGGQSVVSETGGATLAATGGRLATGGRAGTGGANATGGGGACVTGQLGCKCFSAGTCASGLTCDGQLCKTSNSTCATGVQLCSGLSVTGVGCYPVTDPCTSTKLGCTCGPDSSGAVRCALTNCAWS